MSIAKNESGQLAEFGIRENVSAADYHADRLIEGPTLSRSSAQTLIGQSPLHCWTGHPRLNPLAKPDEGSPEMDLGDICHQLMLGNGRGIVIFEGETWRGNEAKAFREKAEAEGVTPIKRAEHTRAMTAISEWRRQLSAMGLDYVFGETGQRELTLVWKETVNCNARARLDWCATENDRYEIWDLKTTENAAPERINRAIGNMGYDLQEAWYLRGYWNCRPETTGRGKFYFLFAETVEPFAILPYATDGIAKAYGEQKAQQAIASWSDCMKNGVWPGYSAEIYKGESPAWLSPKNNL